MAADGAWPKDAGPERIAPTTRRTVDELQATLGRVDRRLASRDAPPLEPEAAAVLAEALHALARRIAREEEAEGESYEGLSATVEDLVRRLDTSADHWSALATRSAQAPAAPRRADRARRRAPMPHVGRALLAAGGAAVVLGGVAAVVLTPARLAPATAPLAASVSGPAAAPSLLAGLVLRPSLPLLPDPGPAPPTLTAPPQTTAQTPAPAAAPKPVSDAYLAVAAALERGEASARARLVALAQAGDVHAQSHLGGLYESGAAGLPQDLAAARFWTRKAADAGDRVAMYNLGLYLADLGGPANEAEAVRWFRRAAERGVVDAQYNLGLLYEAGRGAEKNLREAYRWFSVAANAGDAGAREKQVALEASLRPSERGTVERSVQAYDPDGPQADDAVAVIPPAETLAETQALLARKGYYVGPVDGVATPALRTAVAAYVRDNPQSVAR